MGKKLKIGIVGGGLNSAVGKCHFSAIVMDHEAEIVTGFFSTNLKVNSETGRYLSIPTSRVHKSIEEFAKKEKGKIDLVVVLTPTDKHFEHLKTLIPQNFSIVCEKSLTTSSKSCKELEQLQKKYNSFIAVTYNYSGYPFVREAKKIIESGSLGHLLKVKIDMPQESYIRECNDGKVKPPQDWRMSDLSNVSKISLDLGIHIHQLVTFLTGEKVLSVIAKESTLGAFKGVVDDVSVLGTLTNEATYNLTFSKALLGNQNGLSFKIFGTKMAIEWHQCSPNKLLLYNQLGKNIELNLSSEELIEANHPRYNRFKPGHPHGFIEAFANYYQDIFVQYKKFKQGHGVNNDFVMGILESKEGIMFLEMVSRSSKEKKEKKIDRYQGKKYAA